VAHETTPDLELGRVVEEYLAELEAGRQPDRTRWIADHPHLAPSLEAALAGLDFIHNAAPATPQTPVQLGDFRIIGEIGRGGMGVVYEAEQISLKRRVALKVLRHGPVADELAMRRFQREAETVGRLHHTNIVPIFAIGADDGVRYYAMQFIEGRDLGRVARELRNTSEPADFQRIADWGLQAADALAHAHQRGVIHRDIKPSNLILDPDNRIWLTDFGLARRVDDTSLSLSGALLGTPRYMSPEQAAATRQPIDHRTDLYSLGATLYELVTGRPIFEANSPHEVISQILNQEPAKPRSLNPAIPRDLETVILKCLAKEPQHRYASAQTLTDDLRAFVDGRPIAARRPRIVERTHRWVRHHRRLVLTAATASAASALLLTVATLSWKRYADARLARLHLASAQPGAVAEVLDAQGESVLPPFPVPNPSPVALPAGSYQVRLSAPDTLSESWPITLSPGRVSSHTLSLPNRWLWPPQELGAPQSVVPVPLNPGTGFLVLLPPESGPDKPTQPLRLRLLDGATAKPVWSEDLRFDASTLPGNNLMEWQNLLAHWAIAPGFAGTRIADRTTDLDRDGAGDFILVSRASASILAVSGASGRILWWHRSHPSLPPGTPTTGSWSSQPGQSFVVSHPDIADLDADGIDDVVASFHARSEVFTHPGGSTTQPRDKSWVAAISGRTGLEMWRRTVDGPWSDYATSSTGARFDSLAHPTILHLANRRVVALPENDRIRLWDARTGEPVEPSPSPGFTIDRAPLYVPTDTPLPSLALVTRRYVETDAHLEIVAFDLASGTTRWRQTPLTVLGGVALELDAMPLESIQAVQLETNAPTRIATLTGRHPKPNRWTFGLQVLDAASGTQRWETILHDAAFPQSIPSEARFLPGPDLDQDGSRELFVMLPAYDHANSRHGVLAAALSGADGSILWRRHHPAVGGVRSLAWWHNGPNGHPLLVATTSPFSGNRTLTVILDPSNGRIAHTLPDVRDVHIADFDGDGAPDLLHPTRAQNALRWAAIRGQPTPAWQALGSWLAGPDANADGTPEVYRIANNTLAAQDPVTHKTLWSVAADFASPETLWTRPGNPASPHVLAVVNLWRDNGDGSRQTYRSLAAFSTRDGRRAWTASDLDLASGTRGGSSLGWAYDYPNVETSDLDGDAFPEVFATFPFPYAGSDPNANANTLQLSVVNGANGKVLWSTPVTDGAMSPDPRPAGPPIADFNRDGIRDLALILPPKTSPSHPAETTWRVDVLHGTDGSSVWPAPFPLSREPGRIAWPEPTLGDLDGDDIPEVLVVRHSGYTNDKGYPCELVVLDGRSGQVRWTWSWNAGFPAIWAPLVLTAPDPANRRVALGLTVLRPQPGIREIGSFGVAVLDAQGTLVNHRAIRALGFHHDRGGLAWQARDLDGDGTDELLYPDDGALQAAFGPALLPRWNRPLAKQGADGFRLIPDPAATVILWNGRDILGIEGSRGDVVWRGRAPSNPVWGNSATPHLRILPSTQQPPGLPRLQFVPPVAREDSTTLDTTWPTHADGRYLPPQQ
jgi:serine/threonine protein kinase